MNYSNIAATYASRRWALPWKLQPLLDAVCRLNVRSQIVDIGCGTGDYLFALHQQHPDHNYEGYDLSPKMLDQACTSCPWATLVIANADDRIPSNDRTADFIYSVDVLHHLQDYRRYFAECVRLLRAGRALMVFTDSEEDIRARTLAELFPDTVPINLERYPAVGQLVSTAEESGLRLVSQRMVSGYIDLDDRFMGTLSDRAISELRLISDDSHAEGMKRAQAAREQGGKWLSQTTVLSWVREGGS
jgi:predicted TPR repeat methyltransferase